MTSDARCYCMICVLWLWIARITNSTFWSCSPPPPYIVRQNRRWQGQIHYNTLYMRKKRPNASLQKTRSNTPVFVSRGRLVLFRAPEMGKRGEEKVTAVLHYEIPSSRSLALFFVSLKIIYFNIILYSRHPSGDRSRSAVFNRNVTSFWMFFLNIYYMFLGWVQIFYFFDRFCCHGYLLTKTYL